MEEELSRRREEVIQLKSILATRQLGVSAVLKEQYGGADFDMLNEDGELEIAYRTMKDTNRYVLEIFLTCSSQFFFLVFMQNIY